MGGSWQCWRVAQALHPLPCLACSAKAREETFLYPPLAFATQGRGKGGYKKGKGANPCAGQENGARVKKSKKRAGTMHRVDHQAIVAAFFIKALIFSGAPSVQTSLNHNTIDIITIINAK